MYAYLKMEMPETCGECPFNVWSEDHEHFCVVRTDIRSFDGSAIWRVKHCPLIEVPDPHGRLIDADALHKLFEDQWHYLQVLDWNENPTAEAKQSGINWCINTMHDDAPTIIPASEEAE